SRLSETRHSERWKGSRDPARAFRLRRPPSDSSLRPRPSFPTPHSDAAAPQPPADRSFAPLPWLLSPSPYRWEERLGTAGPTRAHPDNLLPKEFGRRSEFVPIGGRADNLCHPTFHGGLPQFGAPARGNSSAKASPHRSSG